MDYGLSYKECKIKNSKVFFYETFDSRIADKIIRLNKYLYYIEVTLKKQLQKLT